VLSYSAAGGKVFFQIEENFSIRPQLVSLGPLASVTNSNLETPGTNFGDPDEVFFDPMVFLYVNRRTRS